MKDRTEDIFNDFLVKYPQLEVLSQSIYASMESIVCCYYTGGKVIVCGNGGSASDTEHIVGEFMKGFRLKRPLEQKIKNKLEEIFPEVGGVIAQKIQTPIPAISLVSQSALMTAICNDIDSAMIFAQQAYGYCRENDVLIAISTSGSSMNVIYAAMIAKVLGTKIISFTGANKSDLAEIADIMITVPAVEPFSVQELHLPVYHVICAMVESELFDL